MEEKGNFNANFFSYNALLYWIELEAVREDTIGPDDKKLICHYITNSDLFAFHDRKKVYPHEIWAELLSENEKLFRALYDESSDPSVPIQYTNPTKLIVVNGWPEYAFICPCRSVAVDESRIILQHYVSREYNVSDAPNNYIAGRFVFTPTNYNDENSEIKIFALAEEPAIALSSPGSEVEREYLQRRVGNEPCT